MYTINLAPDEVDQIVRELTKSSTDKFQLGYERRGANVESVTIQNESDQDIQFAFTKVPDTKDISTLPPKGALNIQAQPKEIYVRRTEDPAGGSEPLPKVAFREYSYSQKMIEFMFDWAVAVQSKALSTAFPISQPPKAPETVGTTQMPPLPYNEGTEGPIKVMADESYEQYGAEDKPKTLFDEFKEEE